MRRSTIPGAFSTTAAVGATLLLAAVLFDAEPLYVPGVALTLAALGAAVWVLVGTVGTIVERSIGARRAVEDEPVEVTILTRPGITVLPGSALSDPLLKEPLPLKAATGVHRVRIEARFSRRGRRVLEPPTLEVGDPLGLMRGRVLARGNGDELLVLPRIEPVVTSSGAPGGPGQLGRRRTTAGAAETVLDGLRPHRVGAPASRIYWPALARGGVLLERRMTPEADARPLVALDARGAESDEDLDAAVRAVASLAVHLAKAGGCALLLPGDRRAALLDPPLHGWSQLHVRLALLEGGGAPPPGAIGVRRASLIWVAARRIERAPRGLANANVGRRVLVVPGRLPNRRAAFSVAGCSGYLLGASELGEAA
jgi:uncharacterized protein (DUF58 family)